MGWVQVPLKNFRHRPHAYTAVEVWEHAGFEGDTLHTMAGMHVNRNGRKVYATAEDAVREPENPQHR